MPKRDPLKLVNIHPQELRDAIEMCRERVEEIDRERMRLLGAMNAYRAILSLNDEAPPTPRTLADAVFEIMAEVTHALHARAIIDALKKSEWATYRGNVPTMATLVSTLQRDNRFERLERPANTWTLSLLGRKTAFLNAPPAVAEIPETPPPAETVDPDDDIPF